MHGKRHPVFDKTVRHQRTGIYILIEILDQIPRNVIMITVLPVAAHGQCGFDVHIVIDRLGLSHSHHSHACAEVLVAVVVSIDIALRRQLIGYYNVNAAVSANPPK